MIRAATRALIEDAHCHDAFYRDGFANHLPMALVALDAMGATDSEIVRLTRTGTGPGGKVLGRYEATGVVPHFAERVELAGTDLSGIFQRSALR